LIFIDFFTKWVEAVVLHDVPTSDQITEAILSKLILRHGCISVFVSDKGVEFINNQLKEVCDRLFIHHVPVPMEYHQANGLSERFMRTL
jgi:hypothetical protein